MERVFSGDAEAIARQRLGEGERKETIKCNYTASSKKRHSGRNKYRDRRFTLFHFTKPQRLI